MMARNFKEKFIAISLTLTDFKIIIINDLASFSRANAYHFNVEYFSLRTFFAYHLQWLSKFF